MATSIIKASFRTDTIYKWPSTFANMTMSDIVTQLKQSFGQQPNFACQFDFYNCTGMPTVIFGHAIAFFNNYFTNNVLVAAFSADKVEVSYISLS